MCASVQVEGTPEALDESHGTAAGGLLTEAIREYLERRRVRPVVMQHLDDSIAEKDRLGRLLAR